MKTYLKTSVYYFLNMKLILLLFLLSWPSIIYAHPHKGEIHKKGKIHIDIKHKCHKNSTHTTLQVVPPIFTTISSTVLSSTAVPTTVPTTPPGISSSMLSQHR